MKGLLLLFEDTTSGLAYARDTENYYNLKITKIDVILEGVPKYRYRRDMRCYDMWEEVKNYPHR